MPGILLIEARAEYQLEEDSSSVKHPTASCFSRSQPSATSSQAQKNAQACKSWEDDHALGFDILYGTNRFWIGPTKI